MNTSNPITVGDYQYEISAYGSSNNWVIDQTKKDSKPHKYCPDCRNSNCVNITATNNPDLNKQGVPGLAEAGTPEKKQIDIQAIKDHVAMNNGNSFSSWDHFMECFKRYEDYSHLLDEFIEQIANEAINQYREPVEKWIEIKSVEDLPTENGDYWFCKENEATSLAEHYYHVKSKRCRETVLRNFTHYTPKLKPSLPTLKPNTNG